jgi:hypothetical protein
MSNKCHSGEEKEEEKGKREKERGAKGLFTILN